MCDPALCETGDQREKQPLGRRDNDSNIAVDERNARCGRAPGEESRYLIGARQAPARTHVCRSFIGCENNLRIEDLEQGGHITAPRGAKEGFRQLTMESDRLAIAFDVAAHAPAGPAGELTGGLPGATDQAGDLVERQGEHIVQHERHALQRTEALQDYQESDANRVGHERYALGIFVADQLGDLTRRRGVIERNGMLGGAPASMA